MNLRRRVRRVLYALRSDKRIIRETVEWIDEARVKLGGGR